LTIFEIIVYYICTALGCYNIYRIRIDPAITEDTFEISPEIELANQYNEAQLETNTEGSARMKID